VHSDKRDAAKPGWIRLCLADRCDPLRWQSVDTMHLDGLPGHTTDRRELSGSPTCVRIAVDPSMEAMSETSCFAHSVQQVSDPLSVLKLPVI
jgi:hypothetical protein